MTYAHKCTQEVLFLEKLNLDFNLLLLFPYLHFILFDTKKERKLEWYNVAIA